MKLEWNLGGWLGAQLGGTAWILVAALLSAIQDAATGLILLALFAVPNVIGLALWRQRDRISCYPALQALLLSVAIGSAAAVYALENRGLWESIQVGGTVSGASVYGIIGLVTAVLMLTFHLRFGRDH